MPHVEMVEVDLSTRGVQLPRSSVGMVIAQPYLTLSQTEPYRCKDHSKPQQLDAIATALGVARTAPHGAPKTHFTLFPEYSIPGLDGVDLVGNTLGAPEWPKETIVIGGTDGLSREDFVTLADAPNTNLDTAHNDPKSIRDGEWINCGITWVKGTDGTVERWLQPKLCPAWPEQNVTCSNMFRGNSVLFSKVNLTLVLCTDSAHLFALTGLPQGEVKNPGEQWWRHYPNRRISYRQNSLCPGSLLFRTTEDHLRKAS